MKEGEVKEREVKEGEVKEGEHFYSEDGVPTADKELRLPFADYLIVP